MLYRIKKQFKFLIAFIILAALASASTVTARAEGNVLQLSVTDTIGSKLVNLNWHGEYPTGAKFKVQVRENYGDYRDQTSYLDSDAFEYTYIISGSQSALYCFRVAIYSSSHTLVGYTNEVYLPVGVVVNPSNLKVNPLSSREIYITWDYPDYKSVPTIIERKASNETAWRVLATLDEGIRHYTDISLSPNTSYTYRIKAVLGQNLFSQYITSSPVSTMLNEPTGVNAVFIAPGQVHLTWSDDWTDNVYIDIEKKTGNGEFVLAHTVTEQDKTSWVDENIVSNGSYVYRIRARTPDSSYFSPYSSELPVLCVILSSPGGLTASAVSPSEIRLTWVDNTYNESGFELWRKAGESGSWEKYADIAPDIRTFTDTGVSGNTPYYYRIRSYLSYSKVFSEFSNDAWVKTTLPDAGIKLDYSISSSHVRLEWKYEYNNEKNYKVEIERLSDSDTEWKVLASPDKSLLYYTDYGTYSYKKYYYRLKLVNIANSSIKYSNEITVIPGTPYAPSGLELTLLSPDSIKLQWKDNSFNEDGFIIERKLPSLSDFIEVTRVDANTTSYIDRNLYPGELHYYRIKSFNKTGSSTGSNEVYTLPSSPKNFQDLWEHGWAKEAIENLSSRGVIKGKTDSLFFPDDHITRAEFTSLVIRSFQLSKTPVGYLADVNPSDWYYRDIMTAKILGIISDAGGHFYPDVPITREDMAVIIYRTLKAIEKPLPGHDIRILDGYADRDLVDDYALPCMASLKGEKIIDGRSSTILAPKDTATRAEAAVIIYRIIDR